MWDLKKEQNRKINVDGPEAVYIFGHHAKEIDKCISHNNKKCFETLEEIFKFIEIKVILTTFYSHLDTLVEKTIKILMKEEKPLTLCQKVH